MGIQDWVGPFDRETRDLEGMVKQEYMPDLKISKLKE